MKLKVGDRVIVMPGNWKGTVEKVSNLAEVCGYSFGYDRPMLLISCPQWKDRGWIPAGLLMADDSAGKTDEINQ